MNLSTVEYDDVQGIVRYAYGFLPDACFYVVDVADVAAARAWLAAAPITTAVPNTRLTCALQVALSYSGLEKFEVPGPVLQEFSAEFKAGMTEQNRSRRLGDIDTSAPRRWQWGKSREAEPHLLVMLYAAKGGLPAWEATVKDADWERAFTNARRLETKTLDDLEPFGFVDGISQPRLDWERSEPTRLRATGEFTNISALGEFLLGYPNEYGRYTDRPLVNADEERAWLLPLAEDAPGKRDFGRNGSYLVLRDLEQDVSGFHDFIDKQTKNDVQKKRELVSAMSGRVPADIPIYPPGTVKRRPWPEGTPPWRNNEEVDDPKQLIPPGGPVTRLSQNAIDGVGPDLKDVWLGQFTFKTDPDGATCPYGAHIRRANPRNADLPEGTRGPLHRLLRTLGFASRHPHEDLLSSTRFHRILRRGRGYGPQADKDKKSSKDESSGLRFICLNANLSRQFEFIQTSWLANPKFNGLDEDDPLLGTRTKQMTGASVDTFTQPQDNGVPCRTHGLPQFVTVRGGAYFFLPGLAALRYIAGS
jgi:deferrochelatase/peroxidase EfeB